MLLRKTVVFEEVNAIEGSANMQALHIDNIELYFEDLLNHKLFICLRCSQLLAEENDSEDSRKNHVIFHKQLDEIAYKLGIDLC